MEHLINVNSKTEKGTKTEEKGFSRDYAKTIALLSALNFNRFDKYIDVFKWWLSILKIIILCI